MVDTKSATRSPATALTRSAKPSIVPARVAGARCQADVPVCAFSSITQRAWPGPSGPTCDGAVVAVAVLDVAVGEEIRRPARDVVVWNAGVASARDATGRA